MKSLGEENPIFSFNNNLNSHCLSALSPQNILRDIYRYRYILRDIYIYICNLISNSIMPIIELAFRWEQMNVSIIEMLLCVDITAQKGVLLYMRLSDSS